MQIGHFRRRFYNRNHLVKSKYGVHPAGYRVRRKRLYLDRYRLYFNRGHEVLRRQLQVDQHLMAVIGVERAPMKEIVRLIWVYIRNNNLQNPLNRKMIIPDQTLAAVIGPKQVDCFKMMTQIRQHIVIP
jgi:chromatin remodeling complex protein RSC6